MYTTKTTYGKQYPVNLVLTAEDDTLSLQLVIFTFCQNFGHALDIPAYSTEEISYEIGLQSPTKKWIHFHLKLLRQCVNSPISEANWLSQYWKSFDILGHRLHSVHPRESYQNLSIHIRSLVLKSLCERAFDGDLLANFVKVQPDPHEWRLRPLGIDSKSTVYWYFGTKDEPLPTIYQEVPLPVKPSGRGRNLKATKSATPSYTILEFASKSREDLESLAQKLLKEKKNRVLCENIRSIASDIDKQIQKKINTEKAAKRNGLDTSNIIDTSERRSRKRVNYAELDSGDVDTLETVDERATVRLPYEGQRRSKRATTNMGDKFADEYEFE